MLESHHISALSEESRVHPQEELEVYDCEQTEGVTAF